MYFKIFFTSEGETPFRKHYCIPLSKTLLCIKVTGKKYKNVLKGNEKGNEHKYICWKKYVHQISPFGWYISNFLHVWEDTSPSDSPFEGNCCIHVTGKIQNYWKKEMNKKYIKKESNKSLYLKHSWMFFIIVVIYHWIM